MAKIKPEEFYSATQVQKLAKLKSRQSIIRYIREKSLKAIVVKGEGQADGGGTRYGIKGAWAISFIERLKSGAIKREKYTIAELKVTLNAAVDYCVENKITTLKELIASIRRLK